VPLIKGAIHHRGAAFIDVISPCVAFNNHAGSTKSYDYVREHNDAVNRLDVIRGPQRDRGRVQPQGETIEVAQHDGSLLRLRKTGADYDPRDRIGAMNYIAHAPGAGRSGHRTALRGPGSARLPPAPADRAHAAEQAGHRDLCPGSAVLAKLNASLR
jgi:2-oxoglutarate ferredoxin oxidoreductase subunit beta